MGWLKAGDNPGDEKTFDCRVTASYLGELEGGSEYIEVMFAEKSGGGNQAKKLWLTENGWKYTEQCLQVLGWDPEETDYAFEELGTGDKSPLAGAECEIVVKAEQEQDGDRVFNNVAFINAVGGGMVPREKMSRDEAEGFADRVRRNLRLRKKKRGRRSRSSRSDDDKERKQRIRDAAAEGDARQRRSQGADQGDDQGEDDAFDDIPF